MKILSEFEERLILLGFDGIFGWNWVIFGGVKSGKNVDFKGFYRSVYRTQNGGRGVETSDMPFLAIERLL